MSKRPASNDKSANAPVPKRSRLDIEGSLAEAKDMTTELLDALKAQKSIIQWGKHVTREDTMTSIAKAETLVTSLAQLEQKSKSASETVEVFIDAIISSELKDVIRLARKEIDEGEESGPESLVMEGLLLYEVPIKAEVIRVVKDKMQGLAADAIIAKAKAETEGAFREVASKRLLSIFKVAMGTRC